MVLTGKREALTCFGQAPCAASTGDIGVDCIVAFRATSVDVGVSDNT